MIEKLNEILKEKIGDNFESIAILYSNEDNYAASLNSKDINIEMPFVFISKKDFSTKFFPMCSVIQNDDLLKGYKQIYPFDQEEDNDGFED